MEFTAVKTQSPQYSFIEALLHTAFPIQERRDDLAQREITDHRKEFTAYLIQEDQQEIGFVTVWNFIAKDPAFPFAYIEHLAIDPSRRNSGYGSRILQWFKTEYKRKLVLEVEPPHDELSRRRIDFYQRCGLELCSIKYFQPPYRKGGEAIPLFLMHWGWNGFEQYFEQVRNILHREVYGLRQSSYPL